MDMYEVWLMLITTCHSGYIWAWVNFLHVEPTIQHSFSLIEPNREAGVPTARRLDNTRSGNLHRFTD